VDFHSSFNHNSIPDAPDLDTASSLDDMCCFLCNNVTNHLVTLGSSINPTQKVVITNKSSFDAASVAYSTFQEATNDSLTAAVAMAHE
jgi:hypothetical protein